MKLLKNSGLIVCLFVSLAILSHRLLGGPGDESLVFAVAITVLVVFLYLRVGDILAAAYGLFCLCVKDSQR